jgi:hypothetical protein
MRGSEGGLQTNRFAKFALCAGNRAGRVERQT